MGGEGGPKITRRPRTSMRSRFPISLVAGEATTACRLPVSSSMRGLTSWTSVQTSTLLKRQLPEWNRSSEPGEISCNQETSSGGFAFQPELKVEVLAIVVAEPPHVRRVAIG